jgi:hypothetical protein
MATDKQGPKDRAELLAEQNPRVDLDAVTEAMQAVGELRRKGLAGPKYDLASPYGRSVRHSASEGAWAQT